MNNERDNVIGIRRHVPTRTKTQTGEQGLGDLAVTPDLNTRRTLGHPPGPGGGPVGLDSLPSPDAIVDLFEQGFDTGDEPQEQSWHAGTETGARSTARRTAGTSSPASRSLRRLDDATSPSPSSGRGTRAGHGSLGVLMPTLLPTKATFTGRNSADLGALTHALIGAHVQFLYPTPFLGSHDAPGLLADDTTDCHGGNGDDVLDEATLNLVGSPADATSDASGGVPGDLLNRMYAVAYAVINANPNATRVLATEATSLACRYLCEFPPAPPWRLLGVEYETGNGRVDLAWVNDTTGEVFFDEVKTSRVLTGRQLPPTWLSQARRYSAAGTERIGAPFLGTRLVPLTTTGTTRLVRHREPVVRLAPTRTTPLLHAATLGGQR